ncbi:MAG: restriction endonuclease [Deltaproteobacteria bacterium]
MPVFDGLGRIMRDHLFPSIGADAARWLVENTGATEEAVREVLLMVADHQDREWWVAPEPAEWDGHRSLWDLFDCELVPTNEEAYLDQRFLDYLAVQGDDLDSIHWRNFERMTAEFFARVGYKVTLGRGTKDGGVDVRAWTDEARTGPPLVLVQATSTMPEQHPLDRFHVDRRDAGQDRSGSGATSGATTCVKRHSLRAPPR